MIFGCKRNVTRTVSVAKKKDKENKFCTDAVRSPNIFSLKSNK